MNTQSILRTRVFGKCSLKTCLFLLASASSWAADASVTVACHGR